MSLLADDLQVQPRSLLCVHGFTCHHPGDLEVLPAVKVKRLITPIPSDTRKVFLLRCLFLVSPLFLSPPGIWRKKLVAQVSQPLKFKDHLGPPGPVPCILAEGGPCF